MKATFDNIVEIIRINNIKYFNVKSRKGDTNAYVYKYNEEKDLESNIEALTRVMNCYPGHTFILEGKENANANRGAFCYEFSNIEKSEANSSNIQIGGISEAEVDRRIRLAQNEMKTEFMKQDLERREKELRADKRAYEAEKASAIGIAIQQAGKFLPRLFPKVAVAGVREGDEQLPANYSIDENQVSKDAARAEELINRFAIVEPQWLQLLESVVVMAESGDSTYNMAKSFLIK